MALLPAQSFTFCGIETADVFSCLFVCFLNKTCGRDKCAAALSPVGVPQSSVPGPGSLQGCACCLECNLWCFAASESTCCILHMAQQLYVGTGRERPVCGCLCLCFLRGRELPALGTQRDGSCGSNLTNGERQISSDPGVPIIFPH